MVASTSGTIPASSSTTSGSREVWIFREPGSLGSRRTTSSSTNPVDNLATLAAHRIPILHVYGDADEVVPWEENSGVVAERYRQMGGSMTLIAKPGCRHHPHGLPDPTPVVDFIMQHTIQS